MRRAPRTAPAARLRLEAETDPRLIASIAMRARLWALLRGVARAEPHGSSATRPPIPPSSRAPPPGCARVHLPAHRSPNFWLAAPSAAARRAHATFAPSSMFDAFKSALFGAGASFAIPDAFSLDDLASLSRKVRDERAARGEANDAAGADAGPLATLGLNPDQIDAIVRALTDEERARPGMLRPPEHRRVAERANALMTASSRDAATENAFASTKRVAASDVASAIQHAAMLAVVMRRVKKALARGAAAPTSWEQFAAIVERSQAEATEEELREDARSMDGAFPATRPCPCRSGRKYKSCCSPHRGGNGK